MHHTCDLRRAVMADVNSVAAELSNVALDAPARLPEEPESAALSQAATIFQGSISFQQMNLPEPLLQAVSALGYKMPSDIQSQTIPAMMAGYNVVAKAPTGSGKTAAFGLGVLCHINPDLNEPQALILNTTRELAIQSAVALRALAANLPSIKVQLVVKSDKKDERPLSVEEQKKKEEVEKLLSEMSDPKAQIIVATTGTLLDRLKKKQISVKSVKRFVLDEADMLIEDQAKAQTRDVRKALPKDDLQVALFSATFPDRVNALREELCPNAMVFATQNKNLSLSNIHQYYIDCNQKKDAVLEDLFDVFGADGQVIIFANTKDKVKELAQKFRDFRITVAEIHGDLLPYQRDIIMSEFRANRKRVLVASDVVARGIDVVQTSFVVNYDVPHLHGTGSADCEIYLHRIGRAGRFGRAGIAFSLVNGPKDMKLIKEIGAFYSNEIKPLDSNPANMKQQVDADLHRQ